jgi:lipocalin
MVNTKYSLSKRAKISAQNVTHDHDKRDFKTIPGGAKVTSHRREIREDIEHQITFGPLCMQFGILSNSGNVYASAL